MQEVATIMSISRGRRGRVGVQTNFSYAKAIVEATEEVGNDSEVVTGEMKMKRIGG